MALDSENKAYSGQSTSNKFKRNVARSIEAKLN